MLWQCDGPIRSRHLALSRGLSFREDDARLLQADYAAYYRSY
jgi:hypothetical protein